MPTTTDAITIDVVSDVVCPWCYIGKRRLESALVRWAEAHPGEPLPEVRWLPFQLNPDMPEAGIPRREYVERKFGPQGARNYERVAAVGTEVGIPFAFDRIERQPNTIAAHTLIGAAGELGLQEPVVEAFFRAYFLEGRDLTDRATLEAVATSAGMSAAAVKACLDDAEARETAAVDDQRARESGVEGVPFFIFNRKVAVSGAHPAEALLAAMEQAQAVA